MVELLCEGLRRKVVFRNEKLEVLPAKEKEEGTSIPSLLRTDMEV